MRLFWIQNKRNGNSTSFLTPNPHKNFGKQNKIDQSGNLRYGSQFAAIPFHLISKRNML